MPKTKFQEVIFTIMMVFVMVYAMICYNIALNIGGMSNEVFLSAFHELVIMGPIAFVLDFFLSVQLRRRKRWRSWTRRRKIRSIWFLQSHLSQSRLCVRLWVWQQPFYLSMREISLLPSGYRHVHLISRWHCAGRYFMRDHSCVFCSAWSSERSRKREICRKHLNNVFYWGIFRISIYLPNNFCPFFKIVWGEYWYMCILYPIGSNFQTCDWGISW